MVQRVLRVLGVIAKNYEVVFRLAKEILDAWNEPEEKEKVVAEMEKDILGGEPA